MSASNGRRLGATATRSGAAAPARRTVRKYWFVVRSNWLKTRLPWNSLTLVAAPGVATVWALAAAGRARIVRMAARSRRRMPLETPRLDGSDAEGFQVLLDLARGRRADDDACDVRMPQGKGDRECGGWYVQLRTREMSSCAVARAAWCLGSSRSFSRRPFALSSAYLPVSAPPASVAEATMLAPLAASAAVVSGSSTGERRTRLYGSCTAAGIGTPWRSAVAAASASRSAGQLSRPHARSLPLSISAPTCATPSSTLRPAGGCSEYARSRWSSPMRASEASSSPAASCSGQNSHHSLLATVTSSRFQPEARNSSPKTTSE